jgi:hypothetical protein
MSAFGDPAVRTALTLCIASILLFAAGCSTARNGMHNPVANPVPASSSGSKIAGRVHGGQQPVSYASVYLYSPSTLTRGHLSFSLMKQAANTVADGGGDYCREQRAGGELQNRHSALQLVELVGAAAPVVTPIAAGVANNTLGSEP